VEVGDVVGQVGLSGDTNFPHLHFTVRRNRETLDPFTGLAMGSGCGRSAGSLWSPPAQATLAYRSGGLLASGFAKAPPSYPGFLEQGIDQRVSRQSPALIVWMVVWGARAGDRWSMRVTGPNGEVIVEQQGQQPEDDIQAFRFLGRKRPPQGWPPGSYRASFQLTRTKGGNPEILVDHQESTVIE